MPVRKAQFRVHAPVEPRQAIRTLNELASNKEYLPQQRGQNVAFLTARSAARHAFISRCLVFVGFGEKITAAMHIESWLDPEHIEYARSQVKRMVKYAGPKAAYYAAGVPTNENSIRSKLLGLIRQEFEANGARLLDKNISRLGDLPNVVVINPSTKEFHIIPIRSRRAREAEKEK